MSLFGLNSSLVRFLPGSDHPDALVTQAVAGVSVVSIVVGLGAVAALPVIAPRLGFVGEHPLIAAIFIASGVLAAVNLLTDAVFIAGRKSQYNILTDGVLQGLPSSVYRSFLSGSDPWGIFGATGIASIVAVAASFYFLHRVIRSRIRLQPSPHSADPPAALLQQHLRLQRAEPHAGVDRPADRAPAPRCGPAGFDHVAFQVTNLINAFATAVGEAVFAEGSHDASQFSRLMRRAAKLLAIALGAHRRGRRVLQRENLVDLRDRLPK